MLLEQLATAIDCEGSMGINRITHKNNRIQWIARMSLAMLHPAFPLALKERFGGSMTRQPNPKGNYLLYVWHLSGNKQIRPVLESLLPHLIVKKENAVNLIGFVSTFIPRHRNDPITLKDTEDRDAYWKKAKALNHPAPATTERDTTVM